MKLSQTAINRINVTDEKNALLIRLELALALKVTERWISKCLKENTENGPLTKGAAIQVLQDKTGLSFDQILESEPVEQN